MKTIKITSAIGLLILAILITGPFTSKGGNIPSGQKSPVILTITYVVYVHLDGIPNPSGPSWIEIRDQNDNIIGHPLQFIPGVSVYRFTEHNSVVTSIRSAQLITSQNFGKIVWFKDVKHGPFIKGKSYSFSVYPIQ
jgi:hypothetical protein